MKRLVSAPAKRREATVDSLRRNAILDGLTEADLCRMISHATTHALAIREKIYAPETAIRDVYFPLDCVLSIVTQMKNGDQIEIGTVGREGMSAFPLLLGASSTANDCYCQVPGEAVTIGIAVFRELTASNVKFNQQLDRYLQAYVNMLGQLAACNRLHNVYERRARWLLMTRDRTGRDTIPLTHEYLAMMLGTNRSGVTIAVGALQQAGFIASDRGTIVVLDQIGLEAALRHGTIAA
jgi:CRP-like cAMP-binding protein